jgi:DNA-directed RNA polymerase subunit RPC12/RpoP
MSIRFTCLGCRTVLKIGEMITEERKVRCTGCGIVIVVSPDPADPMSVVANIPEQPLGNKRKSDKELGQRRNLLLAVLGVVFLLVLIGIIWSMMGPSDRGGVEGSVTIGADPLEKGTIHFIPHDTSKSAVNGPITQGKYRIPASTGPFLGMHKVEIRGEAPTGRQVPNHAKPGEMMDEYKENVDPRFHEKSDLIFDVKSGTNRKDWQVEMKKGT